MTEQTTVRLGCGTLFAILIVVALGVVVGFAGFLVLWDLGGDSIP